MLYEIKCEWNDFWFRNNRTWRIEVNSEEELENYLEKIAYPGCIYKINKIIFEPVKIITYNEILENYKNKEKERVRLKRKKLFEELKAEFEPATT